MHTNYNIFLMWTKEDLVIAKKKLMHFMDKILKSERHLFFFLFLRKKSERNLTQENLVWIGVYALKLTWIFILSLTNSYWTYELEYMLWNWHEELFYPWPTPLNPTVVSIFLKITNDVLVNGPLIHLLWCRWTRQHSCIYTVTRDSLVVINAKTWESHDLDTSRQFLF